MSFKVKYQAGPYSGTRKVYADDEEQAIAFVRAWVRMQMTLTVYLESYKVLNRKR